jgi:Uma2 family endonuclease
MFRLQKRLFNVDEYHRIGEIGVLDEEEGVELIEGQILLKWPKDDRRPGAPKLFTVDEYYRMGEAGILTEDDRVELIEGEIVEMAPIGSRHASVVNRLTKFLVARSGDRATVLIQNPIRLNDRSEPQPDVTLAQPRSDFYAAAHPGPNEVILIVEVSNTTLDYDREVKLPIYSRSGVPEVWIVDIESQVVEVYLQPSPSGYESVSRRNRGESVAPAAFAEVRLTVDEVLG